LFLFLLQLKKKVEVIVSVPPSTERKVEIAVSVPPPTEKKVEIAPPKRPLMNRMNDARNLIPYLSGDETELTAFWDMWKESLQLSSVSTQIEVSISGDMQQLHWESTTSSKSVLPSISKFFNDVGAPESEVEFFNSRIKELNPSHIGSWIDVSMADGMDGGWKLVTNSISIDNALKNSDGEFPQKIRQWANKYKLTPAIIVRDVGESLPRPSELRFCFDETGREKCLEAWSYFGIPSISKEFLDLLQSAANWNVVINFTTESIVRLGIQAVIKDKTHFHQLCSTNGNNKEKLIQFGTALGKEIPNIVEFQYLIDSFGYGVYKEGFDLHFIYNID